MTRSARRGRRTAGLAVAVLPATLLLACGSEERFCTLGAALPSVEVDVAALPEADEVCVFDDACVPVGDGTAALSSPVITNATREARLLVRDAEGAVLADAEVRLPHFHANGRDCGGDAPVGTVTFGSDGGVGVSEDAVGDEW